MDGRESRAALKAPVRGERLKLIDDQNLVANAGETGAYFNAQMREALADHPHVGDVRGEGLLCAVEFVDDKKSRTFFDPSKKIGALVSGALLKHGVIGRAMPQGDILGFAPPFCITRAEALHVVAKTREAVKEVLG